MSNSKDLEQTLTQIEENFQNKYHQLCTNPAVRVVGAKGPVMVRHSVKEGRHWKEVESPALMTNPEFAKLREECYLQKRAALRAYE